MIRELISKKGSDKTQLDTSVIEVLNGIKYKNDIDSMDNIEAKIQNYGTMPFREVYFRVINNFLKQEIKQKNCIIVTKVNRALLKLIGKSFQGIASLIRA